MDAAYINYLQSCIAFKNKIYVTAYLNMLHIVELRGMRKAKIQISLAVKPDELYISHKFFIAYLAQVNILYIYIITW